VTGMMDLDLYLRFALALGFVIGLIGLIGWLARRYGVGGNRISAKGGKLRRLSVIEVQPLDAKRRLVLIRRDGTEHLLLCGQGRDIVVESNIRSEEDIPAFAKLVQEPAMEAVQ
jgi:flagellar protein FliO/FliZ